MPSSDIWLPLATLVGGAALGGGLEWLRDHRAWKRGREEREDARAERRETRRADFQHATLLDLQTALTRVSRGAAKIVTEDVKAFMTTGEWATNVHSRDASEELGSALRDVYVFAARVEDGQVRLLAARVTDLVASSVTANHRDEALRIDGETTQAMRTANERIGEVLRSLP